MEMKKIELNFTKIDKALEIFGCFSVIAIWLLTIVSYNDLPDIIPKYFNAAGVADNWGEKSYIWTLPVIATICFVVLTLLNKFKIFNFHFTDITHATRLISYVKLVLVVILLLGEYRTIKTANEQVDGLGILFFPFVLVAVSIPLIYYYKISKV